MPILQGRKAGSAHDKVMRLADFEVPADAKHWLVKELGGEDFSSEKLDALESRPGLTREQKALVAGMQLSRVGNLRGADTTVLGSQGVKRGSEVDAPMRRSASMLHGLAELEGRCREQMPWALVGQTHTQASFEKMAAAHESVVRRPAPLMALCGNIGHGKDEAIAGYTRALFGDEAMPIPIDVSSFEKPGQLAEAIDSAVKALPEGGVIRFTGVENLAATLPKHSAVLLAHLSKHRVELDEPRISYFLDFDQIEQSTRQATTAALSPMGNRLLSADASFCLLDAEAMRTYAKRLIPELMSIQGMQDLQLDWTPAAIDLLGHFLATEHAPLIDLEQRLTESVLIAVSVRKSVDPKDVVRIDVSRAVAKDEAHREALLSALHEQAPDYFKAEELFTSLVVANQDIDLEREQTIADGYQNLAALLRHAGQPEAAQKGKKAKGPTAIDTALTALAVPAGAIAEAAAHCVEETRQVVLPPALRARFTDALTALLATDLSGATGAQCVALTTAAVGWGAPIPASVVLNLQAAALAGASIKLPAKSYAYVAATLPKGHELVAKGADLHQVDNDNAWVRGFTVQGDVQATFARVTTTDASTLTLTSAKQKRQPDVVKPDVVKPDVVKPDVIKPDVIKPDVIKPDVAEPLDLAKPHTVTLAVGADGYARITARIARCDVVRISQDQDNGATMYAQADAAAGEDSYKNTFTGVGSTRYGSKANGLMHVAVHAPKQREVTVTIEKIGDWLTWEDVRVNATATQQFLYPVNAGDKVRVLLNRNNGLTAQLTHVTHGKPAVAARTRLEIGPANLVTVERAGTLELTLRAGAAPGSCKLFVEKLLNA